MTTRRFTTADLENLTKGTAGGPWTIETVDPDKAVYKISNPALDLMTAAPALATELLSVRRELEERIRVWQKVADKLEASGDTDVAEVMRHVGRSVARILNGDTNE